MRRKWWNRGLLMAAGAGLVAFILCLPSPLFERSHSSVLLGANGELLNAITAQDGQWRFPERSSAPEKFREAIIAFEDDYFTEHNGVHLPALIRAALQNAREKRVVSGGSTLTMQVVRLAGNNPPRTLREKLLEIIRALRMEYTFSKEEILALYSSHAPFGGNVVGVDAAAWRYYGHSSDHLSWAEAATLAVLPNAPSLIFPGKNQQRLLEKRNRLLRKLHRKGLIDDETLELSQLEPLPGKPHPLPSRAPHLLHTLCKQNGAGRILHTSIRPELQDRVTEAIEKHIRQFQGSHIHNAAALVIDVKTGEAIAYAGNVKDEFNRYGNMVDVIPAPRSTGSILKPFLYASMLRDGLILPHTLVPDIPVLYDGFAPSNYSETFDGAVPASQALSRSLNIPSVIMLKDYGYSRFYHQLKKLGFSHLHQSADHYGLSLILGGAEASLWDVCHAYAGMSRMLTAYSSAGTYDRLEYNRRYMWTEPERAVAIPDDYPAIDAGSAWLTFQSLLEVNRPESELGWDAYTSAAPIAWKTGTSFGNRDAWAVGTTPEFVVGVWVGNADGQGRPELTGVSAAAPVLFDIFAQLSQRSWFTPPAGSLRFVPVCRSSGMLAGPDCPEADTMAVPLAGAFSSPCTFHRTIHLDAEEKWRVTAECYDPDLIQKRSWFVLPPVQEYYYRSRHPEYIDLPPFAPGCDHEEMQAIGLVYPKSDSPIFIPRNLSGQKERVVLKATHRSAEATVFWHLDKKYLGETRHTHEMEISPEPGDHELTLMDSEGNMLEKKVRVIAR